MIKRIFAASLALIALLLCACAGEPYSPIEPTAEEAREVAKIGGYSVLYDELRFVVLNSREGIANTYGVDWSDPEMSAEYADELEESVWSSLMRNYAVCALFKEAYGEEHEFDTHINEQVADFADSCGGMGGYREYLAENGLTDRLVRFNLTVSLMEYELLSYYTDLLKVIDGSEATVADFFFSDDVAHVMHICLEGTDERTLARAEEICYVINYEEADVFEFAEEYSTDYRAMGDDGEYIIRGDYMEEYEEVAFSLNVGEAECVTVGNYTYVICVLDKEMEYFIENYDTFYYGYLYSELDKIIEGQCDGMSIEKTALGESLDLVGIR